MQPMAQPAMTALKLRLRDALRIYPSLVSCTDTPPGRLACDYPNEASLAHSCPICYLDRALLI